MIKRDLLTGNVLVEEWWREGPAPVTTVPDGWSNYGHFHREDGPAYVMRDPVTGAVVHAQWWYNGKCLQGVALRFFKRRRLLRALTHIGDVGTMDAE